MEQNQNQEQDMISHMRAITISREYGSGGGEVAARLAQRLGWQLIDHEVVVRVARELGVSEEEAEAHDERTEGFLARFLNSLQVIEPMVPMAPASVVQPSLTLDAQAYQEARTRVIAAAVAKGHVVIVGRGAQVLLAQRRDVLHVRIVAPLELRVAYVMSREKLDQAAARVRVQTKDRDRIRYLQSEHRLSAEDAHLYDIVINTGILDLDTVVDFLVLALERKAKRLSVPTGELGPAAGLAPYPTQPADFGSPKNVSGPLT